MAKILLTSADFVRTTANISENLQDKYLQSAIRETQDIDVTQVLGSRLVTKLCELISGGTIDQPQYIAYKDLLDGVLKYFMVYQTVARVCVISSVKIDNFGLTQTSDEHLQALNIRDIFQLEKYYEDKADYYKKRLQDFLKANKKAYPELVECASCCDGEVESELDSAASTGLWLGGIRGKGLNRKRYWRR